MKIRTQLTIMLVSFGLLLALIVMSLVVVGRQVDHLNSQEEVALEVERGANDLSYLSNDYLLYREIQLRDRWQARYDSLSQQVSRLDPPSPEDRAIVDNIEANQARLKAVFVDSVRMLENAGGGSGAPVDAALVQVSWSRLQVQNQEMIFNASLLWKKMNDEEDALRQQSLWLLFALVGVFGLYLAANYYIIYRRVLRSLSVLQAGASAIGSGNLNQVIPVPRADEIGDLARAFNEMAANLKEVTASKTDLKREVIERELTEAALRESEYKYRNIIETANEGIWITDSASKTMLVNRRMTEMLGYSQDEMMGKSFYDFVDPQLSQQAQAPSQDRKFGLGEQYEFPLQCKDGQVLWAIVSGSPLKNASGEMVGYLGMFTDITGRKRAEERVQGLNQVLEHQAAELQQMNIQLEKSLSEEQVAREEAEEGQSILESVMAHTPEVLIIIDAPDANIRMISRYAETLLGRPVAELLGVPGPNHPFRRDLYKGEDGTPLSFDEMPMARTMRTGEVILDFEFVVRRPDGDMLTILSSAGPIRDRQGNITGAIAAWRDLSARKRSAEKIRDLNKALERRAVELEIANQELESFSYSVSHDLRTPLSGITGFASLLLRDYGDQLTPEVARYLGLIHGNSVAMTQLIEELLSFSRFIRLPLNRQTVDVNQMVNQVREELRPQYEGRSVKIIQGDLCSCEADPVLFKQVWMNLLSNALKFTRTRATACIEIDCHREEDDYVYRVQDNGVGFDPDHAERLFGVFQRLHSEEEYEGTGVGLATVERVVRRHGGRIWAEAEVDKGATFYFTIPVRGEER